MDDMSEDLSLAVMYNIFEGGRISHFLRSFPWRVERWTTLPVDGAY